MLSASALSQPIAYVLLFLLCIFALSRTSRPGVRQGILLLASLALYFSWAPRLAILWSGAAWSGAVWSGAAWFGLVWFGAVLGASIIGNFLVGKWLSRNPHRLPLSIGIAFNLLLLAAFKYLPEFAARSRSSILQPFLGLALPLGISFWTFQALSYLFDVYREEDLDPTLSQFALYMAFFPVTIAGPVCRLPEMLPQFRSKKLTSAGEIVEGLRRIAIGVFMMQLAKLLGQGILAGDGIARGFDHTAHWSGPDVWCLAFGYGLQLFFDFAGYSHIAIGASKALGITVPENFDRPFASTNPSIFWTRWHMSLSFWIRDYIFFPLAALRRELWWRYLMLAFSMVIFGIWHKATLLFLIWGAYHGVLLVLHRQIQQAQRRFNWNPPAWVWISASWILTTVLISLGWIFFRSNSLSQAAAMLQAAFSPASYSQHFLSFSLYFVVITLGLGYAFVLYVAERIAKYDEALGNDVRPSPLLGLIARWRWFWIPSLYALALLFVFLVTHGQEASAGQLMYRRF